MGKMNGSSQANYSKAFPQRDGHVIILQRLCLPSPWKQPFPVSHCPHCPGAELRVNHRMEFWAFSELQEVANILKHRLRRIQGHFALSHGWGYRGHLGQKLE